MKKVYRTFVAVVLLGQLVSCSHTANPEPRKSPVDTDFSVLHTDKPVEELKGFFDDGKIPVELLYWNDADGEGGRPNVKIDKNKQMGYFYRGKQLVGFFPVSTGKSSISTPEGEFSVQVKEEEHQSYYGDFVSADGSDTKSADIRTQAVPKGYTFVPSEMPFFMRLVGNVGIHQGYVPGKPASHGCIRVPDCMAEKLYRACPLGTKVVIIGDRGPQPVAKKSANKQAPPTLPHEEKKEVSVPGSAEPSSPGDLNPSSEDAASEPNS